MAAEGLTFDEVAQVAHDLRGPLSTIALDVSLVDVARDLDPQLVEVAIARVSSNVQFLDRMVQDLLDMCALDSGQFVLHRRPTDLRELLVATVERSVPTRHRGRVVINACEGIVLEIDEVRIGRVIENLLHNAIVHTSSSSGIVARLDRVGDRALVSVIDAGPGIPPDERDAIFDKYCRGGTAASGGCGLGLYIGKRIVEGHGGRIGVSSRAGFGSCFFFELPLR